MAEPSVTSGEPSEEKPSTMVLRGSDEVRSDAGRDRVVPPSMTRHEDAARRAECQETRDKSEAEQRAGKEHRAGREGER